MKDARRDVDGLPSAKNLPLFAQAHLGHAFEDKVNFLLVLVMPGHLATAGFERDVPHREVAGLNGTGSAYQVLGASPGRVGAAGDMGEIGYGHVAIVVSGQERRMSITINGEIEKKLREGAEAHESTIEVYLEHVLRAYEEWENRLEELAIEGLESGEAFEPGPGFWEEKHRELEERLKVSSKQCVLFD